MNGNRKSRSILLCILLIISVLMIPGKIVNADVVFGTAKNLGLPVNTSDYEWYPRLEVDGLSLHFIRNLDEWENWVATRATKDDPWDNAVRLEGRPNWYASFEVVPGVTTMDGLEVYLWATLPQGYGSSDIYMKTREAIDKPWSSPVANIGSVVNTQYSEGTVSVSSDGLELYFDDIEYPRPGGHGGEDLWITKRVTRNDPWQEPENLGLQVNSSDNDARPHISANGLTLFFDSRRPGGQGGSDLYMTRRKSLSDPWEQAINLGPTVNSSESELNPCISADGFTFLFVRNQDLWQASIQPLVDLNGDGIVDCTDICIITEFWGTSGSLCDIAPPPFGDGIVNVQDMILLTEHLYEETIPAQ